MLNGKKTTMRERTLANAEQVARRGSLQQFLTTAIKHRFDRPAFKAMREALKRESDPLTRWQKREAMSILAKDGVPDIESLTVEARVTDELKRAAGHLMRSTAQSLKDIPVDIGDEAHAQMVKILSPDEAGLPTLPVRQTVHETLTSKFNSWAAHNRPAIAAFREKFPDARIIIDRLPEDGAFIAPRIYSDEHEFAAFLKDGLRTTRKVKAPHKPTFGKGAG